FEAMNENEKLKDIKGKSVNDQNSYYTGLSNLYFPNGKSYAEGEIFKNPGLANSLEKIAKGGRDVFYKGDIARDIDAFMKKTGGFLSLKDLADHTSTW